MSTALSELIRFKLTPAQRKAAEERAAAEGLSLSAWLRRLILRETGMLPKPNRAD